MQDNDDPCSLLVDGDENVCICIYILYTLQMVGRNLCICTYIYIYVFITGHHLECTQPGSK